MGYSMVIPSMVTNTFTNENCLFFVIIVIYGIAFTQVLNIDREIETKTTFR